LILAVRAIRRDDMFHHRRWMIRAFAVGLAVGTIRIWLGMFVGLGLLEFEDSFAPAFWISFSLHALGAELWLRRFPNPPELAQPAAPALAVT
jgi:predicted membrane metal-binding protein